MKVSCVVDTHLTARWTGPNLQTLTQSLRSSSCSSLLQACVLELNKPGKQTIESKKDEFRISTSLQSVATWWRWQVLDKSHWPRRRPLIPHQWLIHLKFFKETRGKKVKLTSRFKHFSSIFASSKRWKKMAWTWRQLAEVWGCVHTPAPHVHTEASVPLLAASGWALKFSNVYWAFGGELGMCQHGNYFNDFGSSWTRKEVKVKEKNKRRNKKREVWLGEEKS